MGGNKLILPGVLVAAVAFLFALISTPGSCDQVGPPPADQTASNKTPSQDDLTKVVAKALAEIIKALVKQLSGQPGTDVIKTILTYLKEILSVLLRAFGQTPGGGKAGSGDATSTNGAQSGSSQGSSTAQSNSTSKSGSVDDQDGAIDHLLETLLALLLDANTAAAKPDEERVVAISVEISKTLKLIIKQIELLSPGQHVGSPPRFDSKTLTDAITFLLHNPDKTLTDGISIAENYKLTVLVQNLLTELKL